MKPQSIKKVKFNKQRLITKLNEAEETEEDFQTYPNVQTVQDIPNTTWNQLISEPADDISVILRKKLSFDLHSESDEMDS